MTQLLLSRQDSPKNECQGVCKIGQPSVLLMNLNACQAVMNLGTHLDYSEFTPDVSKGKLY
ncbi:MAG: hypothetical protein IPO98_05210 [Saprospiraceae bacterium]|nr:hypothetical protein [Saprospiraceae bacterium]